jgi:hypothetical protein
MEPCWPLVRHYAQAKDTGREDIYVGFEGTSFDVKNCLRMEPVIVGRVGESMNGSKNLTLYSRSIATAGTMLCFFRPRAFSKNLVTAGTLVKRVEEPASDLADEL